MVSQCEHFVPNHADLVHSMLYINPNCITFPFSVPAACKMTVLLFPLSVKISQSETAAVGERTACLKPEVCHSKG